ncbi:MAG: DinB family protein [Actinobacteria bacterium]|nr:DinB family protein [Actinomycetota bacterium]
MEVNDTLAELFGRIPPIVRAAVGDLSPDELVARPAPHTNPIGWLVWHLSRVGDHHLAELIGEEQVWVRGDWAKRFGLEADPDNTGYGHSDADVAAVRPESAAVLVAYHEAVAGRTAAYAAGLRPADLDRVVDTSWDPPVTLGARLVSVAVDDLQHAGQAAYVRGLLRG